MTPYTFLILPTTEDYKQHFRNKVCCGPVTTPQQVKVFFPPSTFEHAFFEAPGRDGVKSSEISPSRAQRMDWIRKGLADPSSQWFAGWDKISKRYVHHRAACVVGGKFVIVVRRSRSDRLKAEFMTCYWADNSIDKILKSPAWRV